MWPISGSNFTNVQAVKAISASTGNAVGNSYVVNSSSQITATADLAADTYSLQVSTASGTANSPNLVVNSPIATRSRPCDSSQPCPGAIPSPRSGESGTIRYSLPILLF